MSEAKKNEFQDNDPQGNAFDLSEDQAPSEALIERLERSARERKRIVDYDLTDQDRIIRGRLPQLDVIYEKLLRDAKQNIAKEFACKSSVILTSTEFLKFGEFINTLPYPSFIQVIRTDKIGDILVVVESKLAAEAVAIKTGFETVTDLIQPTAITMEIVSDMIQSFSKGFTQFFGESVDEVIAIENRKMEVNPQFVGICPPTEIVIATSFDVEIGNKTGSISIVLTYSGIEEFKSKLSTAFIYSKGTKKIPLAEKALGATVSMEVIFGRTKMDIFELDALNEGDVIDLEKDLGAYSCGERVLDLDFDENKKLTVRGVCGKVR